MGSPLSPLSVFKHTPNFFGTLQIVMIYHDNHNTTLEKTKTKTILTHLNSSMVTFKQFNGLKSSIRAPYFVSYSRGGTWVNFWVGMCHPGLQIGTPF